MQGQEAEPRASHPGQEPGAGPPRGGAQWVFGFRRLTLPASAPPVECCGPLRARPCPGRAEAGRLDPRVPILRVPWSSWPSPVSEDRPGEVAGFLLPCQRGPCLLSPAGTRRPRRSGPGLKQDLQESHGTIGPGARQSRPGILSVSQDQSAFCFQTESLQLPADRRRLEPSDLSNNGLSTAHAAGPFPRKDAFYSPRGTHPKPIGN